MSNPTSKIIPNRYVEAFNRSFGENLVLAELEGEGFDEEKAFSLGYNLQHGFEGIMSIIPCEHIPEKAAGILPPKPKLMFSLVGYKYVPGNREEPPSVDDYEIGKYPVLCKALEVAFKAILDDKLLNIMESEGMAELCEEEAAEEDRRDKKRGLYGGEENVAN